MIENPDFEQNYYSKKAADIYETGYDSIRLMRWMAFYDRDYENPIYFGLMASVLICLNETFYWRMLR